MKRILSFALAIVLLSGLSTEVFAVDNSTKTSYFAKHNLDRYLYTIKDVEGVGLPFKTFCWDKKSKSTMGTVTVKWARTAFTNGAKASPRIFVPAGADTVTAKVKNKTIAKKFSNIEGYEWRGVRLYMKFGDGNFKKYGAGMTFNVMDYYTGDWYCSFNNKKGDYWYSNFTVEKNNRQHEDCRCISWFDNTDKAARLYVFFRVPIGYDGATVGLYNNNKNRGETPAESFKDGGIFFRLSNEKQTDDAFEKQVKNISKSEYKTWYKGSCSKISYEKLSRDPRKYDGRKIKFTGYVVQVCDEVSGYGWGYNEYRLATKGKYGDVIYVNIPGRLDRRILEGDKITVWGEYDGLITYTTIFGGSVTIPEMTAEYYSIK